jgi:integrase
VAGKRNAGEGSIFRRTDGRWCAILSLGWENGLRKRKSFYGDTAAEVQEQLLKARGDVARGLPVAIERQTVGQFFARWLEDSAKLSTRPRTFERYQQLTNLHILPALGSLRLEKLTPAHLQRLLNDKLASGLSPKTVRHIRGVANTALGRAAKWGLVARNVAALTDAPRLVRSEMRAFSAIEASRFMEAVKAERLEALYLLSITLGLRRGEVLALKWDAIDFENRTVHIRTSLQRVNGSLQLSETKTAGSRRQLPMLDFVARALRAHHARQSQERLIAGYGWADAGFAFTTRIGTPVDPANLLDDFKRILKKADLPDIRFHDLRHSAASLLLALNVHPRIVMELLGHSQISLTMNTYSHVVPDVLREAVDKLGVALGGS